MQPLTQVQMHNVTLETSEQQLPSIKSRHDSGETMPGRPAHSIRPHAAPQQPVPLTLITKAEVCTRQSVAADISTNHSLSILAKRLRKKKVEGRTEKSALFGAVMQCMYTHFTWLVFSLSIIIMAFLSKLTAQFGPCWSLSGLCYLTWQEELSLQQYDLT